MLARLPVRYWGSQEHEGPLTSPGAAVVVRDFSGISGACGCGSGSVSISGCEDATSVDEGAVASVGEGDVDVIDVDADSVVVVMGGVRVNSPGDDTGDDGGDDNDDDDDDDDNTDDTDDTDDDTCDTDDSSNDLTVAADHGVEATVCHGSAVQDNGLVATHLRGTKLLYTAVCLYAKMRKERKAVVMFEKKKE